MCGRDISPNAIACPHCGEPMKVNASIKNNEESNIANNDNTPKKYKVILSGNLHEKIGLIKAIRELTGLGLKEAKELVDFVPSEITVCDSYTDAQKVSELLKHVDENASIEITECSTVVVSDRKACSTSTIDRVANSKPTSLSVKCPNCNSSIGTHKISGTSRAVGIFTFGIFSTNTGKTWKCDRCGYKW